MTHNKLLALLLPIGCLAAPTSAEVLGRVVLAGFPFQHGAGFRIGAWIPVVVELSLVNEVSFDGILRVQYRDRDGDACFDAVEVHLTQGENGAVQPRRYTLYAVCPKPRDINSPLSIQLLTIPSGTDPARVVEVIVDGTPSRSLAPPSTLQEIDEEAMAVLSIGEGAISKVAKLAVAPAAPFFDRTVFVAHISPKLLPDRWHGLEMIDRIVWDEPDPTQLNAEQGQALVEWVRRGGILLVGAGRTAPAMADSPIWGPLLGVTVISVEAAYDVPQFWEGYLKSAAVPVPTFVGPMNVAACMPQQGTRVLLSDRIVHRPVKFTAAGSLYVDSGRGSDKAKGGSAGSPDDTGSAGDDPDLIETAMVTERRLERGSVIFVAGSFTELLAGECDAHRLFRALFSLRELPGDQFPEYVPIFHSLVVEIGFVGIGSLFLVFAFMFIILYLLASTWGAWWFLARRRWSKHNWSAFAACAVLATTLSLLAVQATRGWGKRVEQVAIIDAEANSRLGRATCYFGLRTSTDSTLDLWLPENASLAPDPGQTNNYLKPLPEAAELGGAESTFTDPIRYRAYPSQALLQDVRFRATVKQFEGRWQGEMPGWLEASGIHTVVGASPAESQMDRSVIAQEKEATSEGGQIDLSTSSIPNVRRDVQLRGTLTNRFDFPLRDCYILHCPRQPYSAGFYSDRSAESYLFRLPDLLPAQAFDLSALYEDRDRSGSLVPMTYKEWQEKWSMPKALDSMGTRYLDLLSPVGSQFRGAPWQSTLLLATAASESPLARRLQGLAGVVRIGRSRLRALDLGDRLGPAACVLVGFADPGSESSNPVSLYSRSGSGAFRPVPPTKNRAMYRFMIPIEGR